jgi:hypothetical protein
MNPAPISEMEFLLGGPIATWSDFERIKIIKRKIAGSLARLDVLRQTPQRNAAIVYQEELQLAAYSRELHEIESRIFWT